MWQSTSLVTARASVQALYAKEAEFLRTPKSAEQASALDAVRGNLGETFLAILGIAGIAAALTHPTGFAGPLTAFLLLWPTFSYAAAPVNSLAAQRAALPADLRARRRTEFLRTGGARRVTFAAGGLSVAGVAVAAVIALLAPGNVHVDHPHVIGPLQDKPAASGSSPRPSASTPGSAPTSSSSPTPTASTTPTSTSTPSPTVSSTDTSTAQPTG
jgi:hypothetical protein